MEILLVNDDGLESPALIPTIHELSKIGSVTVVIPRYQKSWTSKSQTRDQIKIKKEIHFIQNCKIISIDAQPADCTNFGLYNLEIDFDLVVSGANVGHNVGLHAFYSSGTVGAALEGLISGIKSVSLSIPYTKGDKLISSEFENSLSGISELIDQFIGSNNQFGMMLLNIPYDVVKKKLIATSVHKFTFGKLFEDKPDFVEPIHYYKLNYPDKSNIDAGTDTWARMNGLTSVVMLNEMGQFIEKIVVQDWMNGLNFKSDSPINII